MPAAQKPTLIFVHGAWHTPSTWDKLVSRVSPLGYRCICPALPSCSASASTSTVAEDRAHLSSVVFAEVEAGYEVVMVLHSYAGRPGCAALEGLSKEERMRAGKEGGVVSIAMIASFILPPATGPDARVPMANPGWWIVDESNSTLLPESPEYHFYNDLPADEAAYHASKIVPSNFPNDKVSPQAAWMRIQTFYMLCMKDNALPTPVQEGMVAHASKLEGVRLHVVRVGSGHSPMLSRVEYTRDFVRWAAGEVGVSVEDDLDGLKENGSGDEKTGGGRHETDGLKWLDGASNQHNPWK